MVKRCFIPTCGNTSSNSKKIFILVPVDQKRRADWFQAANLNYVPKGSRVYCCEDHFNLKEDVENWIAYKLMASRIKMKGGVVPHKFISSPLRTNLQDSQLSSSSKKRKADVIENLQQSGTKRRLTFNQGQIIQQEEASPSTSGSVDKHFVETAHCGVGMYYNVTPKYVSQGTQTVHVVKVRSASCNTENMKNLLSVSVQTDVVTPWVHGTLFKEPPDSSKVTSGSSATVTASTNSFSMTSSAGSTSEDWNVGFIMNTAYAQKNHFQLLEKKSRFYLGLPPDSYFVIHHIVKEAKITLRDVLICLKKIRLADTNTRLADDFGVSSSHVAKTFNKYVPLLAAVMKNLIVWQDPDYIESHLPIPFRYRYSKCQSIIDCFEIEIEVPSDPLKQSLTWSNYKKCNTLKYLVSAAPHGVINFISEGYGGRTSDKVIVETSQFLNKLPPNSQVMADRGFKGVASLLEEKNCALVRPASVVQGQQSAKSMVKESRRIAALRIHIERVIRRFREFAMLKPHACIDKNLLHLYDCIVIIVAAIINLQGVLIK